MNPFISIDQRRMYNDLAWMWPIISPPEEYAEETEEYVRLIREHARIPVTSVVNLGFGGGHNDYTLKQSFAVTGIDISEGMLGLARELNPENTYVGGDMRAVRLGQTFDAVTVFDSISYMRTVDGLKAAFQTAFSHLRPGGVFVTGVEETPESFQQNSTRCLARARNDIEISILENDYDPNPHDTHYEATFIYLIRRAGDLTIETDSHLLGLFPLKTWLELLAQVGFEVRQKASAVQDQLGRATPILIGVKPL